MSSIALWEVRKRKSGLSMIRMLLLGVTAGKRSKKQVRDLIKRLENIEADWWCTDAWKAFDQVLPYDRPLIGIKQLKR